LNLTVDNTPPAGSTIAPTANQRVEGAITFKAHASDAYGVGSVQFLVDGAPAGTAVTKLDPGETHVYSTSFDTTALTPGIHAVSAVITDNAGNQTTLSPVSIKTGPIQHMPVLNYHEINPPGGYSPWDQTPQQADAQLAWLKANGYKSVTLGQYQQWLRGTDIGVAKPVLITVDDGLKSHLAWDSLLAKYGFKAVMFVVTGLADNKTPGFINHPNSMSWAQIKALAANGRWEIAFHAGQYGHGEYRNGAKIGNQSYQASCPYFYSCLAGTGSGSSWKAQSVAAYKLAVSSEISAGIQRLKQQVPSANVGVWAAPFNDAGQWTNLYNDPSAQVQAWLPGYLASKFQVVFTQTNPITYGQASGTVGSLTGFNRRYRFEVRTDTTIAQFAEVLKDPAFAR
jgi:peptidoglycan/xylan/chitin deacetylase (PgdA/CDA1 family)